MTFRCAHLSDIHWRGLTRHDEYREAFSQMFETFRELKLDAIFVGGDIVHSKTQGISPEVIDCLSWWFSEMADIAPTHIILGNHDGLIMNKHRQDAISPIINALDNPNLHLYKTSGAYPTGVPGYNWCVFSCFDEETWPDVKPVPGEINIATFHGGVQGSTTDINWDIEGDVDLEFFDDFDFAFLGDIHKLQYLDDEKRVAYPGSTIQQNYGEDPGKGFLFWEIEDKDTFTSTFYEIPHSCPFVTIDWAGNVKDTVSRAMAHPNLSRFRVRTDSQISQAEIKHLHSALKNQKHATEIVFKHDHTIDVSTIKTAAGDFFTEDLRDVNTHVRLMREYYSEIDISDEQWERLEGLIAKYVMPASKTDVVRNIKWSVQRMEFDNTFSYGKGNIINFDALGGILGLFGKNRAGKSSIPGTMMYSLFNTTDRGPVKNLHIINMRKGYCLGRVFLTANGKRYLVERQSVRKTSRRGDENAVTHLNLSEIDEADNQIVDMNGAQRRETEKTLRQIVGTADDFLMTSLASQGEMNNFIRHKATQRKAILTKFLDLNIFDDVLNLAKEDSSELKSILGNVPDRDWDTLIAEKHTLKRKNAKERREIEENISRHRKQLQEITVALATHSNKDLVTEDDVSQKESGLVVSRTQLDGMEDKSQTSLGKIREIESTLKSIGTVKDQFPIDDLRQRRDAQQDLERVLVELSHTHEREKTLLKTQKKSIKLLKEVPCGDTFPTCKFIKSSHENKKRLDNQDRLVTESLDKVKASRKSLKVLTRENLTEKIERYDKILTRENNLVLKLSNQRLDLTRVNNRKKVLQDLIDAADRELQGMRLRVSTSTEAQKVSAARQEMDTINDKINGFDAQRIKLTESIGHLDAEMALHKKDKEKYSELVEQWKMYELLLGAVSKKGIPLQIMASQLPSINKEISKILQGVVGFTVELEAEAGTNDMDIYIDYGDSRRVIECASGMEKMMASLAIRVALINVSSLPKTDLLIIDEGFGALDEMNIEACTRLLDSLRRWFKHILVISHVDAVKDAVDNIIEISQREKNAVVICE